MNPLLTTLTRRTALRLIGGGTAGAALAAFGGLKQVLGAVAVVDATAPDPNATVEPAGGAGLFDVDPDQANVSQDPTVAITGDVASLPVDMVP